LVDFPVSCEVQLHEDAKSSKLVLIRSISSIFIQKNCAFHSNFSHVWSTEVKYHFLVTVGTYCGFGWLCYVLLHKESKQLRESTADHLLNRLGSFGCVFCHSKNISACKAVFLNQRCAFPRGRQ